MVSFFSWIFSTEYWPPRWKCGYWADWLGWLHIVSDLLIFAAYMAIPLILIYFVLKRKDLIPFRSVFVWFALFIVCCGFTHLTSAVIFYYPVYRFDGFLLALTAFISWGTVWSLIPEIPKFLSLPKLTQINELLEEDLHTERVRLSTVYKATDSGIFEWKLEKSTVYFSPEAKTLLKLKENESNVNFVDFVKRIDPNQISNFKKKIQMQASAFQRLNEEVQILTYNGEYRWFKVVVGAPFENTKKERVVIGALEDVTQEVNDRNQIEVLLESLKEKQSSLERSNKKLEEFSYLSAHDLKQPLQGIKIYSEILLEDHGGDYDADTKSKLEKISATTEHAMEVIENLLLYSRETLVEHNYSSESMSKVVDSVVLPMKEFLEKDGVVVTIEPDMPEVQCDKTRIGEVCRNFVTNAVKYSDKEIKKIHFGTTSSKSGPIFYAKDNGIGISSKDLDKVFEMFQRGAADKSVDGMGVGLALVKAIIERHDGAVWVDSIVGTGSQFNFTIGHIPEEFYEWEKKHGN